jgi:hypothetical protein
VRLADPESTPNPPPGTGPFAAEPSGKLLGVNLNLLLALTLALCVIRLWLMPLPSSFWVDEMGTAFVVRHGADDPSLRVAPQVPASIYYVLPRLADRYFGLSETAYRVPSTLALAAALFFIAKIAARLIHPAAGWFAAFTCVALREFDYQAADARPYALGTCVSAAAAWFLIRWLDNGRWRDAFWFALFASLLWRVHLVFWPFYAVFVCYALVRLARADTKVGWPRAAAVFAILGISLAPVLLEALALYRHAGAHVVVPAPTGADLTNGLKLGFLVAFCAAAAALARWRRWPRMDGVTSRSSLSLIVGWWAFHPLLLFAFSRLTGNSVFVPRYLYIALPGVAMTAVVVAALFVPSAHWKTLAVALGVGILLFMGRWNQAWPLHHNSDWRTAASRLNALNPGPGMPVICPSPFIEARPPVWRPDYPPAGFLYAHLPVYPIQGKAYAFPFENEEASERFARALARDTLARSARFAIYGGDHAALVWRDWFKVRPELDGWRNRRLGPFGDVDVIVFEKGE